MAAIDAETLTLVRDAAKYQGMLEYLEPELDRMVQQVEARVFKAIEQGTLSGEQAQTAWMEVHSYRKLTRRIAQRVRIGTAYERVLDMPDANGYVSEVTT